MTYIASVSFGKDSLAMLLLLIEQKAPLDEVVFFNTGAEYDAVLRVRDKAVAMLEGKGIKYIELSPPNDFFWYMTEKPVNSHDGRVREGYGFCGGKFRWGTGLKREAIAKHLKLCPLPHYQYIGIAFDEPKRIRNENQKLYPLFEQKLTERECLSICHENGYSWDEDGIELYELMPRVSCFCCSMMSQPTLFNVYRFLPKYWNRLLELQAQIGYPFRLVSRERLFSKVGAEEGRIEYIGAKFDSWLNDPDKIPKRIKNNPYFKPI